MPSTFEVAGAKTYPGRGFDLIAFFDCLHDMGVFAGAGGGPGPGCRAGEERLRSVASQGGFSRFRRAAETPFNLVFEPRV